MSRELCGVREQTDLGVHLEREHDLRRAVPPGGDVLGHETGLPIGRGRARAAREPKVADLEIAVGVQKQISRFEIAVHDVRRVHRLECAERLVDEVLQAKDTAVDQKAVLRTRQRMTERTWQ